MRKLVVLALALALAGCAQSAEQRMQRIWAQRQLDEDKCRSYGSKPGDPAYVQCRAQLDAARTQADATAAQSTTVIVQDSSARGPVSTTPQRDPMAGHTSDPGWRGLPGHF